MRTVRTRRRTTGLVAAAALAALAATAVPAHAAEAVGTTISGATLAWGVSGEAGGGAYFGGCNFLSAGAAGNTEGSRPWTEADGFYAAESGNVRIEKPTASGGWTQPTWATKCQDKSGAEVTAASVTSLTGNRVVLSEGTGSTDASGAGSISWHGSFTVTFYGGMTYWTASDPVLTVGADGHGTVTATASGYAASMADPGVWEQITPTTVTLADLSDVRLGVDGFTATPDYLGVAVTTTGTAQAAKTAANEGWWGSFPQSFVTFQERTGQSSYWYSSGGSRDAAKPAAPLTVAYTSQERYDLHPSVTATVAGTATGAVVTVQGSEFSAVTNPGDAGVYVGIAPAGGLPDVSTPAAQSNFLTADWVTPARLADGTFTSTLTVDAAAVDRTKAYAVYTWQAHSHSNTSQDTQTPIDLVAALPAVTPETPTKPSVTPLAVTAPVAVVVPTVSARLSKKKVSAKVKAKKRAKVKVTVKAPAVKKVTGKVKVVLKKKGSKAKRLTAKVKNGKATLRAPKLARGKYTVTVRYSGVPGRIAGRTVKAHALKVTR